MNWLAHLYLSEPHAATRIGNLLPDLAPARALVALPPVFQRGIEQHRRIDAFTDAHAVFRRSVQRLEASWRRFGPIVVDILYDHFLTRDWADHCPVRLGQFTSEFYGSLALWRESIPEEAFVHLERIRTHDLLGSYGDLAGVRDALRRTGRRLRRPLDLSEAVGAIEADYASFQADFREFFPALRKHLGARDAS